MVIYLVNFVGVPNECLDRLKPVLSSEEKWRYQHFLRDERATQFLIGRYLLRRLLASHIGMSPQEVPLLEQINNAPFLDLPNTEQLGFSISHSKSWVACGFSSDAKIGLDIELIDTHRDVLALAAHSFNAEQNATLSSLSPPEQYEQFYRYWTAQEAQIKLGVAHKELRHPSHSRLAIALCSNKVFLPEPELVDISSDLKLSIGI